MSASRIASIIAVPLRACRGDGVSSLFLFSKVTALDIRSFLSPLYRSRRKGAPCYKLVLLHNNVPLRHIDRLALNFICRVSYRWCVSHCVLIRCACSVGYRFISGSGRAEGIAEALAVKEGCRSAHAWKLLDIHGNCYCYIVSCVWYCGCKLCAIAPVCEHTDARHRLTRISCLDTVV